MMMNEDELFAIVRRMLMDAARIPEGAIASTVPLEQLGLDSLEVLRLSASFEDQFNIEIETKEIMSIRTVGDIVELLSGKLSATA